MAFKLNNPIDNTNNPGEEKLQRNVFAALQALNKERQRVMDVRANIDRVAEDAVAGDYYIDYDTNPDDDRAGIRGAGVVPKKPFSWLKSINGSACSTYACGIMREAGVTVPESVGPEGITINGITYKPGDKMPIIPGNEQFDALASKLGFELRPPGSMPEEGDVTRVGYGYGRSAHSTIQTGEGQNVYNSGPLGLGLKQTDSWTLPVEFEGLSQEEQQAYLQNLEDDGFSVDNIKSRLSEDGVLYPNRLMQYVGNLPQLQNEYRQAVQASGGDKPITRFIKQKPVQLGNTVPTAQLPTKIQNFFNRNK